MRLPLAVTSSRTGVLSALDALLREHWFSVEGVLLRVQGVGNRGCERLGCSAQGASLALRVVCLGV